eukprot:COSAG05_NODE_1249_length_5388_cov_42.102477_2_plen_186_part_00
MPNTGEIGKALKFLTKATDKRLYKEWQKLEESRLAEEALLGSRHEGRLQASSTIMSALAAFDNDSMLKATEAALEELQLDRASIAGAPCDQHWIIKHSVDLRSGRRWVEPFVQPVVLSEALVDSMSMQGEAKFLNDVSVKTKDLLKQHPSWFMVKGGAASNSSKTRFAAWTKGTRGGSFTVCHCV